MKKTPICSWLIALALFLPGTVAFTQDVTEVEKGFFSTGYIQETMELNSHASLLIRSAESLGGAINITVTDRTDIGLKYLKQARAGSRSEATDFIDLISVVAKPRPDLLVIDLRAPNPSPWMGENEAGLIELNVELPPDFSVRVEATLFSVSVTGPLTSFVAPESLGEFDVSDVSRELSISTKNRRIKLRDIRGEISVSTTNSSIMAVNLESPKGAARFRNDGGEIKIEGFIGGLNVNNKFGHVAVAGFILKGEGNFVQTASAPIDIEIIGASGGQLVINNRYEDINLKIPDTLSAYLSLSVDDKGNIETVDFPARTDLIEQNRLNLVSGSGGVEIVGSIRGAGSIFVRGVKAEDN